MTYEQSIYRRTTIGRFGANLKHTPASDLGVPLVQDIINKTKINPTTIAEFILGNVYQAGSKANPARQTVLKSDLPHTIPAMTINKQCASGMRSITLAYQQIALGEVIVFLQVEQRI